MAFYVENQIYVDIVIDGVQIPFNLQNILDLNITSNIYNSLPAVRLRIIDHQNLLSGNRLNAGSIVKISILDKQHEQANRDMEFILQGVPEQSEGNATNVFTIYGVWNNLKFQKCIEPFFFQGTSTACLRNLCQQCGIDFEGSITDDEMIWISGTKDYASFAKQVVDHGYSGENSCMVSGITLENKFVYKDVNNLKEKDLFINTHVDPNNMSQSDLAKFKNETQFVFNKNNSLNNAGLFNLEYGYKNEISEFNPQYDNNIFIDKLTVDKGNVGYLNIGKASLDGTGFVKHRILPLNIGNVHNNWCKAEYQNIRQKSLFSLQQEFLFTQTIGKELLDKVSFSYVDPMSKQIDDMKASTWIIIGKVIAIMNERYYEKYICVSKGQNNGLSGKLA